MDKIEKIRQEIERRKKGNMYDELPMTIGRYYEDRDLLSFLDTLSEEPSESLEEAAEEKYPVYWKNYPKDGIVRSESAYDTNKQCRDAFIAGANWQKTQMMKEAVEGEAEELYNDGESQCTVGVGTYFKPGEKVYILKAEEK